MNENLRTPGTFLRNVSLFNELDEAGFRELERLAQPAVVSRGGFVYAPRDPSDQVYFLRSGRLKISKLTPEGKEWILNLVEPGEMFGETSLAGENNRRDSAEALEDAAFCSVRRDAFLGLAGNNPALSLRLMRVMGERRRQMETRLEWVLFAGVQERLVDLLLDLGRRYGVPAPEGLALHIQLSQKEISQLIGSTRETTSSTLNQLRKGGLILIKRRRLIIRNLEHLERSRRNLTAGGKAPALPHRTHHTPATMGV